MAAPETYTLPFVEQRAEANDEARPTFTAADEFERWYADNSGITVEQLRCFGRYGVPCDCGEDVCTGWRITTAAREADDVAMRSPYGAG